MHDGGHGDEGEIEGKRERERKKETAKGNGTKREGWVETAVKSLNEEGRRQRGGRWQRTAVATAVEAHEHHFY